MARAAGSLSLGYVVGINAYLLQFGHSVLALRDAADKVGGGGTVKVVVNLTDKVVDRDEAWHADNDDDVSLITKAKATDASSSWASCCNHVTHSALMALQGLHSRRGS